MIEIHFCCKGACRVISSLYQLNEKIYCGNIYIYNLCILYANQGKREKEKEKEKENKKMRKEREREREELLAIWPWPKRL